MTDRYAFEDDDRRNPYIVPDETQDPLAEDPPSSGPVLASRWARLGASMLDGVILLVILLPLFMVFGWFDFEPDVEPQVDLSQRVMQFVLGVLIFLALNVYLLMKRGQTLGKAALGIRIVLQNGGMIPPLRSSYGMRLLPFQIVGNIPFLSLICLVDILFIFRQDKRCLHDLMAGTIVVKA